MDYNGNHKQEKGRTVRLFNYASITRGGFFFLIKITCSYRKCELLVFYMKVIQLSLTKYFLLVTGA